MSCSASKSFASEAAQWRSSAIRTVGSSIIGLLPKSSPAEAGLQNCAIFSHAAWRIPVFAQASRGSGLGMQGDRGDAGGNVEALVAFDADRLQRDRPVEAADQDIGVAADPDRCAAGGAAVVSGQRACLEIGRWRDNAPDDHAALQVADIHAVFGYVPAIMFVASA